MSDHSDVSSNVSEDSHPPMAVDYPLNERVEVPETGGGLHKTVLTAGTGTRPIKGAKVTVHYVGTLEDGTTFDSSRDRGEPFSFTLGKGQVIKGWDKGVATMMVGEKAVLVCSPEYAYGAAGSPPTIPANATLHFEVELLDWTHEVDISPSKDRAIMKDTLIDGVDYEQPGFESTVTLDLAIYVGAVDVRQLEAQSSSSSSSQQQQQQQPPSVASGTTPVWQQQQWTVHIGDTPLPPQLEQCLSSMRKSEVAVFRLRDDVVPAAGDAAFHIPPRTGHDDGDRAAAVAVTYRVHVHELKSVKTWEFAGPAKIAEGVARKDKGNAAFARGDFALAERYYRRALEFVGEDYGVAEADKPANAKARVTVMSNLAQVLLQSKRYGEVREYCNKVLDLEHNNTKALFRLAKAQDAAQDWDDATRTLDRLLAIEPGNTEARALKAHVHAAQAAYNAKQKGLYKKLFA